MKIFNLFLVSFVLRVVSSSANEMIEEVTIERNLFCEQVSDTTERNLFCEQVSDTAERIMFMRQAGYSKEEILKEVEFNDEYLELTQDIIKDAFYWRIEKTIKGKIEVIKDYTYQINEACLKQ